jgi:hypothetical protein
LLTNSISPVGVSQRREISSEPKVFERYTARTFMVRRKWSILAGKLDVAYVGAAPFLVARASGVGIVAVASSNTEGSSLVVTYEIRSITNLHDMKFGSPGMGTIQDYMLTQVEKKFSIRFTHFYAKVTDLVLYFEKRVQNLWADKKEREEGDIRRVCNVLCYSSGCDIPKVL